MPETARVCVKHDCPVCDQLLPALDAASRPARRADPVAVRRRRRPPSRRARARARRRPRARRGAGAVRRASTPTPCRRSCCSTAARSAAGSRACTARASPSWPQRRARRWTSTACPRCGPGCASKHARPRGGRDAGRPRRPRRRAASARASFDVGALEDAFEALHDRGAHRRPAGRAADTRARRRDARAHVARPAGRRRRRPALRRRGDGREGGDQRRDGRLRRPSTCRSCSPRWRPPASRGVRAARPRSPRPTPPARPSSSAGRSPTRSG